MGAMTENEKALPKLTKRQLEQLETVHSVQSVGAVSWSGSSYSVLDALVAKGVITEQRGNGSRMYARYTLTTTGNALIKPILAERARKRAELDARLATERAQDEAAERERQRLERMQDPLYVALRELVDAMRFDGATGRWFVPVERASAVNQARAALLDVAPHVSFPNPHVPEAKP